MSQQQEGALANPFRPAVRQQVLGRIALEGLSKKGKTLAALGVARGLVGPDGIVAMLDCDNGSAKLYAGTEALATEKQPTGFEHANLGKPFHPQRFIKILDSCGTWGVDCIIIDTITAEWSGEGGIQSIVDERKRAKQGTGWDVGTPLHQAFLRAIVQCKAHVIATVRLKSDTQIDRDERGNLQVRKLGLKADQRDQFDYEFTIVGTIMENHELVLEGRGGFAARTVPPHADSGDIEGIASTYVQLGQEIGGWLNSGEAVAAAERTPTPVAAQPPGEEPAAPQEPDETPPADDVPPAGTAEAGGDALAELGVSGAAPASNGRATDEQQEGLIAQLGILSELWPTMDDGSVIDWGTRIDTAGRQQFGDDWTSWATATTEQAVWAADRMERAIRQIREQKAAS